MSIKITEYLNLLLTNEIVSIAQYILHSQILEYLNYNKLSDKIKSEIPDEINHANLIIKRILFLKGEPIIKKIDEIKKNSNPVNMLEDDRDLEKKGIEDIKTAIQFIGKEDDITTSLLQDIMISEKKHLYWIEEQLKLIDELGLDSYLRNQK